MNQLKMLAVVGVLIAGSAILLANPINTVDEFSETWENLAANSGGGGSVDGPTANGWTCPYTSYIRAGNIGGEGDRIHEFRLSQGATIYRSDIKVAPNAAGMIYVSYDYKYTYTSGNMNFTAEYGQGSVGADPYTIANPKVRLWMYASPANGATYAVLYNQTASGNDVLLSLLNNTAYHISDAINTATDTHVITVTNNSTGEVVYTSGNLGLYGDWTDVAMKSMAFRKGTDNNAGGYNYLDNILVVNVPEPMTMGLLALGAGLLVIRKRK